MKIFLFGLIISFFVFKIGFWNNAYSNPIKLGPTEDGNNISSDECMKVLKKNPLKLRQTWMDVLKKIYYEVLWENI